MALITAAFAPAAAPGRDLPDGSLLPAIGTPDLNATPTGRIDLTPAIAHFRVRPDARVSTFEPGQYLAIGLEIDGRMVQRPYSTASARGTQDELEFLIRRVRRHHRLPVREPRDDRGGHRSAARTRPAAGERADRAVLDGPGIAIGRVPSRPGHSIGRPARPGATQWQAPASMVTTGTWRVGADRVNRWWFVQPHQPKDLRSVNVVDFRVAPACLLAGPAQGTIDLELRDEDERNWARRLNSLWLMRGAGLWRMVQLQGPLAVEPCTVSDHGLPERQVWSWVVVEHRGRNRDSRMQQVRRSSH